MSKVNQAKKAEAEQACCTLQDDVYQLHGVFSKETIPQHSKTMFAQFKQHLPVELDLSGVDECDSAFVALLIECKREYPSIHFTHQTETLGRLLTVYQVSEILN